MDTGIGWTGIVFSRLAAFVSDARGNFATTLGVAALPLMMCAGVAADYTMMRHAHGTLQESVDAAALVGVKELAIAGTSNKTAEIVAKQFAADILAEKLKTQSGQQALDVSASVPAGTRELTVSVAYYWEPMLLHYINSEALPIKASATATLTGEENICVVVLDPGADETLALTGASNMSANGCSVYSNSTSPSGISLQKGATLSAVNAYTSGGFDGPLDSFRPRPVTDSPALPDPLASRNPPASGPCRETNLSIGGGNVTLSPGTYCGGIAVGGNSVVTFLPGSYIMKDGPLLVSGNATVQGEFVGFVFEGEAATFDFGVSTQANFLAPKSGPLASIRFFEDRSASLNRLFSIRSKDAERFEGTIYLPRARLFIDKASKLGQASNWTAIITNRIEIGKGPDVQINSDYSKSKIPVPNGVGPTAKIHLAR